jgi:hypothetical protein
VYYLDLKSELAIAAVKNTSDQSLTTETGAPKLPKLILKTCRTTREKITKNQLAHIDRNCLSDPPKELLNIHWKNPKTGKTFTGRGTSTNEADNLHLDSLIGTHIGIAPGERCIANFFEQNNDRKKVSGLGEEDPITYRAEAMALLNSYALESGFTNEELPFPNLSVPKIPSNYPKEFIGFHYQQRPYEDISNPVETLDAYGAHEADININEELSEENDPTLAKFLDGLFEDDTDELTMPEATIIHNTDEDSEESEATIIVDVSTVEENALLLLPQTVQQETTLDAFIRLTEQRPWIPFYMGGTTPKAPTDHEEAALFVNMKDRFCRHAKSGSAKCYKVFASEWNEEMAKRFMAKANGDIEVVLINRKSPQQIEQYYDYIVAKEQAAATFAPGNQFERQMQETLRQSRNMLPPQPQAHIAAPVCYPITGMAPLGTPIAFNPELIAPVLRHATPAATVDHPGVPWMVNVTNATIPATANGPLNNYKKKKWCITCGFRKKDHVVVESYGSMCKRDFCAKCMQLLSNITPMDKWGHSVRILHTRQVPTTTGTVT